MGQQRLKGQEVTVTITAGGELQNELTDIHNLEITVEMENPVAGYLGKGNDDVDEVFKKCSGNMEMHLHSSDFYKLQDQVLDRAQGRLPDLVITIAATFFMPNGETVSRILGDVKFGTMVDTASSRTDFVNVKVPFMNSERPKNQFD